MKECPICKGTGIKVERVQTIFGFQQEIRKQCDKCHGTGKTIGKKCHVCKGEKVQKTNTTIEVEILKGMKDKEEIRKNWQLEKEFTPQMSDERRSKLRKGWKRAVRCALAWADDEE